MYKRIVLFFIFLGFACGAFAQESDTTQVEAPAEVPVINYSLSPKRYKIADIKVTGIKNYDDFVLIGFSGLSVGDMVTIPGDEITTAVKRFWKHGLFSDVKILATKIEGDEIWLEIQLKQRPRISEVNYHGIKKGEREDLEAKLGLKKGFQVTPNLMDRAKIVIQKFFDGKGFKNVDVDIVQRDDLAHEGEVIVDINIDKNEKTKIHRIYFEGNEALSARDLKKAMKKTNEKFSIPNDWKTSILEAFSTKKFTTEEYEKDKANIIAKYNEHGYRDAVLLSDSVVNFNEKKVDIFLKLEEGDKYYLKDIRFVGNTQYASDYLEAILGMKPGEVYNQKKLTERLSTDEDAVSNVYYNNGYIFFSADPVEVDVDNDSISLEVRIQEGPQATINRVIINGNDRLYEDIVRRELRTKPGMLFSREDLMRSVREIAQMGHFDPENMDPKPLPDPENGTVDIQYNLTSKANDQIEFSAGWGQTGVIGKLSLKFTNFSMKNFLNPKTYKGIIPQGEGQTLTLSGQTNGRYYQAYSISFMDPWFGGRRPNTLSVSAYFSKQTDISSNYYNNSMSNYGGYYPGYGYGYGYGGMYGGYGGYNNYYNNNYELAYDPDKSIMMLGLSAGYGKRLNWPDDYFQFMATLNYQMYIMHDWAYFLVQNGTCHNINLELMLQRNSIDNPLYTRRGSQFSLSVSATPPYSLWDGKDYANMDDNDPNKFKFIEYHKWKFKAKLFSPLAPAAVKRTPVLMTRVEYGFLGSYNKHKRSPFETFYMGGDGMSGYSSTYATETIGLRGYENGSIAGNGGYNSYGYAYSRLAMELRYPFLLEPSSTIYGLVFVEAGNAWKDLKSFNPFDLKRSAGVGVRIFLPMIGLMGIDWAYGFDKVDGSRSAGGSNFHFIIGQEF
ncbi:outer membrane protein assembly factor BamA [Parabacteroides gordonii]|uniref:Outer membrane protein assembly factor BamA n=1 Tax=Parabacteroides gordonii MS-1 = DSM 23371 TaxID=1203610 RepID=A0A0F5JCT7_9BACT|nr:outer membrane protein assembly factor BamA [Parabacteroides gordonii]KKB55272.1 outer membrane protein assembly complex, YaeT protein [Parabacteroides gordonii MS-1 = DSM 23371]MCA5581931.1 outer membrane protein assembly factor BamA [Parabacteroides gordonii]RGP17891.1 outer membrane protein assembly factor BamA [Parabacteroides gordonii]